MNDDGRRTVRRQKGERKSDDRRTNNDDERTVRRQNGGDRRTVRRQKGERKSDDRRTNGGDRTTVRRQNDDDKRTETMQRRHQEICESQQVINTRLNEFSGRIDGVEQQIDQVGIKVNRIEKDFQNNKEEMERKLEDTKQQVQREILEKIEGLGHQLHRTSIADSGDHSTSPDNLRLLQKRTDGLPKKWLLRLSYLSEVRALEILQSIPEEQQNDYDRIIGALRNKSRQQRSNESLQEYEADIERLIHLAYPQAPKEFLEQIGIQTFIDGLVDTEMQQALRLGRHTTISDALIAALEFKAAKEASRSYTTRKLMQELNEIKQSNSPQKEPGAATTAEKLGTYRLLQGQIKVSVKNELTRSTARFKIKIQESRQKEVERRKWDNKDFTAQDWSFSNPRPKTSFQITSEKFGKRQLVDARGRVSTTYTQCPKISVSKISSDERSLIVHGYLDDKWCSFVIDTGATRTILRPDILPKSSKELSRHVKLGNSYWRIDSCTWRAKCKKFNWVPKIMYHRVLTADIRDDCILGLDILNYNKSRRIIVEEDIQIPQGSENIIIAKLDGNGEGLIRIANISDKKIILKKNEVLGRCEPVERVVKCEEINQAQTNQAREVSRYGTTIKDTGLNGVPLSSRWPTASEVESPDGVSAVYQLVLPEARNPPSARRAYSSPSGGHFGVTRTLARHESTTYTPSMLTSGREMKLPTDLMLGRPLEETEERSLPEFVEDLRKRMDRIHRFAREKLKIHSDKMKQRLDTTSTETAFKPGDAVWLYAPKRTKGKSPKLQSNWEGPYTIVKKINDLVYRIQLSPRSKPKVVHLERLAKYTGHNPPDWFVVEDPPPRTEDSLLDTETLKGTRFESVEAVKAKATEVLNQLTEADFQHCFQQWKSRMKRRRDRQAGWLVPLDAKLNAYVTL
ncbi:hypothetical protein NQ318_023204 [Aromia moschata]|uniref:Integrase p58-like C-terminal domain-containing protein n=1 Tax=Aromia moschata TaxID=1265417 RepID=A0AAV8X7X3_9CUCU|nr:hypothetical protein NQ318_023204 [Aromia moschata]